jgi:hypothetical protein
MVQPLWKTVQQFVEVNTKLPHDPVILLLGICSKELKAGMQTDTHMPVFTVNNNQKGEVTQMSMIR